MNLTTRCRNSVLALATVVGCLSTATPALSQQASFSDVPTDHPVYEAVEYLKQQGYISGYADGTYKPNNKVNRAETLKILLGPVMNQQQLMQFDTTVYQDIEEDAWFLPYVEAARQAFGIIDGPPKKTMFYGERNIQKAEFLKMLLVSNKVDVNAFSE